MSSLYDYKTPEIIKTEIIMQRQVHKGSFLLLEGPDDSKFWNAYILRDECEIVICGGKENLIKSIQQLDNTELSGILGISDDDFDSIEGTQDMSDNLIYTDVHDLECILLQSRAFEKILSEYGDAKKITKFESSKKNVREALLERGLVYGRLRWLARQRDGISFKRFPPTDFIDEGTWEIKETELYKSFIKLYNATLTLSDLHLEIAKIPNANPWNMCQGHDLVKILAIGLSGVLGSSVAKKIGENQIAPVLRQAIEYGEFCATHLAQEIIAWEQNNAPYQIFSCGKSSLRSSRPRELPHQKLLVKSPPGR